MNHLNSFFVKIAIAVIAISLYLFTGIACTDTPPNQQADSNPLGDIENFDNIILARVGDGEVTLTDLLMTPGVYVILHDQLIVAELVEQEAGNRGVVANQDDIELSLSMWYESMGGMEFFLENQVPPAIPKSLVPFEIRKNHSIVALQHAVLGDRYDEEHGPVTDEEITEAWNLRPRVYQDRIATDEGLEMEDVTLEMAWDYIRESIRDTWISENMQTAVDDMKEHIVIDNYLFDAVINGDLGVPAMVEEVEIPPVDENSFEYIELEHGDEHPEGADEEGSQEDESVEIDDHQDETDSDDAHEGEDEPSEETPVHTDPPADTDTGE